MSSTTESQIKYAGDGEQVLFTFPFTYLQSTDIYVCLYNETERSWDDTTEWTFANATTIQFTTAPPAPTGVVTDNIKIERRTSVDPLVAQFNPGSAIRASDLNDDFEQLQLAVIDNSSRVTSIDVGVTSLTTSGDGLSVDQDTGNITISNTGVTRINSETGNVSLDTDDIPEGSINLYYTDARVSAWIAANLSDTDDLKEGVLNLYYTDARVNAWINTNLSSTDQLAEGSSNLYYTDARAEAVVVNWIAANLSDTDDLPEGSTNLYYTDARVESYIDAQDFVKGPVVTKIVAGNNVGISPTSGTGIVTINATGGSGGGIPEAPLDGTAYGRQDGHWEPVLMLTGGDLTGDLTLGTDKITLDAGTGSATFAGGNTTIGSNYFRQIRNGQYAWVNASISNLGDVAFGTAPVNDATNPSFFVKYDGSASFSGDVTVGDAANANTFVSKNGAIYANYKFGGSSTSIFRIRSGASLENTTFTVDQYGAASFAGGSFQIDSSGVVQTNINSAGDLKLDSTANFSAPNIVLKANDGSATFAGPSTYGNIDITSGSTNGVEVRNDGLIRAQRQGSSGTSGIWQGYNGSTVTSSILSNGSASFSGKVQTDSWFQSNRTNASGSVLYGLLNDVETVNITADGSATFASTITAGGYSMANLAQL
jgi:hypothetical protein